MHFSHDAPGCGLQLPVDSFHSHEARFALWAPDSERENQESLKKKKKELLAAIKY